MTESRSNSDTEEEVVELQAETDSYANGKALKNADAKLAQELVNLRLTEEKTRQELIDLQRPYLLRNPQLLTALITSVGAIIGVGILISGNYYDNQKKLNELQAKETSQIAAESKKTSDNSEKAQAAAKQSIRDAGEKTKAADMQEGRSSTHTPPL